jgi:hypothetical protein
MNAVLFVVYLAGAASGVLLMDVLTSWRRK